MNNIEGLEPLARDVSPREYFRGDDFILMRYPQVTDEHRAELHNFIRIGRWLSDIGIKTPDLYALDDEKCMARFEDLGKTSFGAHLQANPNKQENLYIIATDILKTLGRAGVPDNLPKYNDSRIHKNRSQIIDYYLPLVSVKKSPPDLVADYLSVWDKIEEGLPPCPQGFVHGDFHLENLMYMASGDDLQKCALIDYQDALHGSLPYDLVNLLEDARVEIPHDLRNQMIDRYCEDMNADEKDAFLKWYRVLGTQFHCRVIGLFIKLSAEQGRDAYLIHIKRLQLYIEEALKEPLLLPLRAWFKKESVDFSPIKGLDGKLIREKLEE